MFERLDPDARRAVDVAIAAAHELGHGWFGTEHVLVGLLSDAVTLPAEARALLPTAADVRQRLVGGLRPHPARRSERELLATLGIDLDEVRRRAIQSFGADAVERAAGRVRGGTSLRRRRRERPRCMTKPPGDSLGVAPRLKRAFEAAARRSEQRGQAVSPTVLLAALLSIEDGFACELLGWMGVELPRLRRVLDGG
jgi:hypothetical protein